MDIELIKRKAGEGFSWAKKRLKEVEQDINNNKTTQQPSKLISEVDKSDNRITIRLTPEEIEFIDNQTEKPSGVIHKALRVIMSDNNKENLIERKEKRRK